MTNTEFARFISKVSINTSTGCWLWTAEKNWKGYGVFFLKKKRMAHRASYEEFVGLIPVGLHVHHECNNPPCVNPFHLLPLSNRDNVLRGNGPTAVNARKTKCIRGHPFDCINTRWNSLGKRTCIACHRELCRGYKAKRKALSSSSEVA